MEPQATTPTTPRSPIKAWLKTHRGRLLLGLRLLVAAVLMGIVISLVAGDWDKFINVDWKLIPVAFALTMISTVIKAMRWSLLVRQSHMTNMSTRYLLGTYLVGAFFSTVLPTSVGGDAVRAVDAAAKSGRVADATSSVLIERGIGLLIVVGSGSLFALFSETPGVPLGFQLVVHAMFFGGIIGLVILRQGWLIAPISRVLIRLKLVKIERKMHNLERAFSEHLGSPSILVLMIVYSIISHAMTIAATYIVLIAVTDAVPLSSFVPVIALTTTAELIPISIAALGVKESAYVFFLGLIGVGAANATVIALIMRVLTLARAATGGIVFIARGFGRKSQDAPQIPAPTP